MSTQLIKDVMQFRLFDITATQAYPVSAKYTKIEILDLGAKRTCLSQLTAEVILCYENDSNAPQEDGNTKFIKFLVNPIYQPSHDWILLPEVSYKVDNNTSTAIIYAKL